MKKLLFKSDKSFFLFLGSIRKFWNAVTYPTKRIAVFNRS